MRFFITRCQQSNSETFWWGDACSVCLKKPDLRLRAPSCDFKENQLSAQKKAFDVKPNPEAYIFCWIWRCYHEILYKPEQRTHSHCSLPSGISFTPKEVGEHVVSVKKNGKHVTNSPFKIMVGQSEIGDASKVKVFGKGLIEGHTFEVAEFIVDTRSAGKWYSRIFVASIMHLRYRHTTLRWKRNPFFGDKISKFYQATFCWSVWQICKTNLNISKTCMENFFTLVQNSQSHSVLLKWIEFVNEISQSNSKCECTLSLKYTSVHFWCKRLVLSDCMCKIYVMRTECIN